MKVGVVGCGTIATTVHMPSLKKIRGYELVAAADVNPVRLREVEKKFGVYETYDDYRLLLVKADVDAVFVCTPPQEHFQIAMDAIKLGKHVFCEKPLASTVEEGLTLKKAYESERKKAPAPLFLMPAHNYIFTPCFVKALKLVENGEIGKIKEVNACITTNLQFYRAKTNFRNQAKCGVIEDLLPHLIYLVNRVGGPLRHVLCIDPQLKGGAISDVRVEVSLARGVKAQLSAKWTGLMPTLLFELAGDNGEIKMDLLRTPYNITVTKDGEAKTTIMGKRFRQYIDVLRLKHPSYSNEHIHFLSCVERKILPQISVDDGVELVRTLNGITEFFQGKTRVSAAQSDTVIILRARDNVEDAVQKSINLLGGLTDIKRDSLVLVKPNVCFPKNIENMVTTDLRLLETVVNIVKQKAENVLVVESDSHSGTAEKRVNGTGVMDVVKKCDAEFFNLSKDDVEEHKVADFTIHLPKTVLRADYFINLPKVKTNTFVQISGAMKNMFGIIASKRKSRFHNRLADVLVYLNETLRQNLIIADGIVAMEGMGPILGKPVKLGLIISGKNPITVDAASCHIMGFNPYAVEPLWKAHQNGLGEIDPQQIQFLGEKIEKVRRNFRPPNASPKNVIQALKTEFRLRF